MKVAVLLCLATLVACSDAPSRERFPGGNGRTTDSQQAEISRAMLGGFDPLNNPISGSRARVEGGNDAEPSGATIRGTISLGAGKTMPPGAFLLIAARKKGRPGPPIAAKRLANAKLPYNFTLSAADAMMAGTAFEGEVEITARLDQDGDPLSRQPGDLQAVQAAKVGDANVKILLNDVIQ